MPRIAALALLLLLATGKAPIAAEQLRFWNLTAYTITELHLAPAGSEAWGPVQCRNDPDGAVDADERLPLKDVTPGRYDVRLKDRIGRACTMRGVELRSGKPYAFSIEEKDLVDCRK